MSGRRRHMDVDARGMNATLVLQASHSHLFRGAKLHSDEELGLADGREVLVEFSDGAIANAGLDTTGDGYLLDVDSYTTIAGTEIATAKWMVKSEGPLIFKVSSKVDPARKQ